MEPLSAVSTKKGLSPLEREVEQAFGLVPNFFRTGAVAPGLIDNLWTFAKSAYLDNPLPSLFKERLFVYLSRFCQVRYCIVRHVGFLVGKGHPAGNSDARPQSVGDVIALLRMPTQLSNEEMEAAWRRLNAWKSRDFPEPGSQAEEDVFVAANLLFLEPVRAGEARQALTSAIGADRLEYLLALLAFIQTAHYWTITHPDLILEDDMDALLRDHEVLADFLLNDPQAERCHLSGRLFDELAQLRQERDDREALRQALEGEKRARREQQSLINELNHRVKNNLAIVQSIAAQTLRGADVPATVRAAFEGRLQALARTHDLLTARSWRGANLEDVLSQAVDTFAGSERKSRVVLAGPDLEVSPKQALAFAMAATELTTNAVKFGALSNAEGVVDINWKVGRRDGDDWIEFSWRERGGPRVSKPTRKGFGTRLLQRGVPADLAGEASLATHPAGFVYTMNSPLENSDGES